MLKVIDYKNKEMWDSIITKFSKFDIYYTYYYALSLMSHGDGVPQLIYFESDNLSICYVVMQSDISSCSKFSNLKKGYFFDWETPYGYGGPLIEGELSESSLKSFWKELKDYCIKNSIVSQFIRFNPLLENHLIMPSIIETKYLKDTVYIDTTTADVIFSNMDSKNRNLIRKAQKNNIEIVIKDGKEYGEFLRLYNQTMDKDNAADYYYFNNEYFDILSELGESEQIFYAMLGDRPIAASIMLNINGTMHYHLSGSDMEFRGLCPSNLLLYEAAVWCAKNNITKFHLGGGVSIGEDGLLHFKKQFNKNGRIGFYVGRTIFDKEKYDYLLQQRLLNDPEFDVNNGFMIQYRR